MQSTVALLECGIDQSDSMLSRVRQTVAPHYVALITNDNFWNRTRLQLQIAQLHLNLVRVLRRARRQSVYNGVGPYCPTTCLDGVGCGGGHSIRREYIILESSSTFYRYVLCANAR